MQYYLVAFITLVSAILGMAFSISSVKKGTGDERTNALYWFTRNATLMCVSIIPKGELYVKKTYRSFCYYGVDYEA